MIFVNEFSKTVFHRPNHFVSLKAVTKGLKPSEKHCTNSQWADIFQYFLVTIHY